MTKNFIFTTLLFSLIIMIMFEHTESLSLSNTNQLNARIQCEFRDKDGYSLLLNCTLINGLPTPSSNQDSSQTSNILIDTSQSQSSQSAGSSSASNSQTLNIRVGMDRDWRTPWESLSINHNIIRTLIWRSSKLTELGKFAFKDLNYLQRIDLSFNKLTHLASATFASFSIDILDLDLSHNLFQQVPAELFQTERMQRLESLRLNENPIFNLSKKPFEKLANSLKTLELNYCKIKTIDSNTFEQMRQLESLSLIGNHIRTLNELTFRDLNLRSFYIHDNPFVCDCHLRWLLDFIKNVDYQQQNYEAQLSQLSATGTGLFGAKEELGRRMSVGAAAQQYVKCEQPNSLKSRQNFLDINPDSFMCDIQIEFRDNVSEAAYELNGDALLVCDVYGDPEPDVYWSYGLKPIGKALSDEDDKYRVNEFRLMPGVGQMKQFYSQSTTNKTSELKIKNLQPSDFGVYVCTAEIKGSNNRKEISFLLKRVNGGAGASLSSLSSDLVLSGFAAFLNSISDYLFTNGSSTPKSQHLSNSTIFLLLSIIVSLFAFFTMLFLFICWKFKFCCFCSSLNDKLEKTSQIKLPGVILSKEQERLLLSGPISNQDQLDSHQSQNYTNLANESSATLLSSNKMSSSIRMAQPNFYAATNHQNDIYANHSLLTTTSTTTGSYLLNNINNNSNQIAIDTSNHTPRFHVVQHLNANMESYYDDLRYPEPNQTQIYASPYRQQCNQQSYSPIVRRDDPTVPLYATMKPKLQNHQHQHQHQRQFSNYAQYSTMHRSTPPLPAPRRSNYHQSSIQLPPPPPPPPALAPVKPKRTFEYGVSRDLHSDSGAFLMGEENTENISQPAEYDQSDYDANYQNYAKVKLKSNQFQKIDRKAFKQQQQQQQQQQVVNGSTTSLDEEDLDLNDLKDFEDVTFDNLRKPGEDQMRQKQMSQQLLVMKQQQVVKQRQMLMMQQKKKKNLLELNMNEQNNNSEQSLLLKSSSSSSDKSLSNANLSENVAKEVREVREVRESPLIMNNDSPNTNTNSASTTCTNLLNGEENLDDKLENVCDNLAEQNSKIYEETEI